MKLNAPFLIDLAGWLAAEFTRRWMRTLEYKCAYYDPTVDPVHPGYRGQKIYVFWHEYILFPLSMRGHCKLAMLLSTHTDAEALSRTAYHLGFDVVRGSTYRGRVSALRGMMDKSQGLNLTLTPDGPRGPRRRFAQGAIYLASRLEMPIVAIGFGHDRPWRMKSWDRFALPRPGSRARAVFSPEIHVPSDLDRGGIEHYRLAVERVLNRLTLEAEAWAEAGTRKENEVPFFRKAMGNRILRPDEEHLLSLAQGTAVPLRIAA